MREYQGERHTVTVVPGGFSWQDGTYLSLSAIARAITGTAWNGPALLRLARSRQLRGQGSSTTQAIAAAGDEIGKAQPHLREPSHFGSNCQPRPSGSAPA